MIWINFVGEGRSGHTVVSGALGSHPHIRLSEEQKYISKYRRGFASSRILTLLHESGEGRARREQGWSNLRSYIEPLLAVGDKCGWDAVNEFTKRDAPETIIQDFSDYMRMPVKTIVTLRHPLDNITAWVDSNKYKRIYSNDRLRYRRMIRRYKRFHDAAWKVLQHTDYFLLHNEELIANPSEVLQRLTDFLGLPPNREWRRATAKRIWQKPHRRRDEINWPEEYVDRVVAYINENQLLERYR